MNEVERFIETLQDDYKLAMSGALQETDGYALNDLLIIAAYIKGLLDRMGYTV